MLDDKDTRSRAQKIGDPLTEYVGPTRPRKKTVAGVTVKPGDNPVRKAKVEAAKSLALDYADGVLIAMYEISQDKKEAAVARVRAGEVVLQYALGRPATVHVDVEGVPMMPNLIIISGDGTPAHVLQSKDYEITDDAEEST